MSTKKLKTFSVIGIKMRTTNKDMQASKDIPAFWQQFISEKITEKIPNKVDTAVFAIYTNYESDYTGAYDMILGCKVTSLDKVPKGMIAKTFNSGTYTLFTAKGKKSNNIVYNKWTEIWNSDINRSYQADFEVYGERSMDPEDMEVDIFISVK